MKPLASISFDMDNEWAYLKTHGDSNWQDFPSYLALVVPRVLALLDALGLRATFFIVGQDAALAKNREALANIAAHGHEIGHHSFSHEPWLHRYTWAELNEEIKKGEDAIAEATSKVPMGFRGPGYSISRTCLEVLAKRGYRYDASTLPTLIGPLARAYYFFGARLDSVERKKREALFGRISDALLPLKPYLWRLENGVLLEIPVTTFPILRLPIHPSYLLYFGRFSRLAAEAYFHAALLACRARGISPSILLHPLDFLDGTEVPSLRFFPAMDRPSAEKIAQVHNHLLLLKKYFEVLPVGEFARSISHLDLPEIEASQLLAEVP